MAFASLTRRIAFGASHHYRRPEWSDDENARVFGGQALTESHPHTYTCDVTIRGEIDAQTGMVVDLGELDRVLRHEIRDRFDRRNINSVVPEFADGRLVPTGENLARYIFERVRAALKGPATVTEVTVSEDANLSCTYQGD